MFSFRDIFRMWLIDKKKNREGEAKEVKTSSIQEKPNNFEFRNWISWKYSDKNKHFVFGGSTVGF